MSNRTSRRQKGLGRLLQLEHFTGMVAMFYVAPTGLLPANKGCKVLWTLSRIIPVLSQLVFRLRCLCRGPFLRKALLFNEQSSVLTLPRLSRDMFNGLE